MKIMSWNARGLGSSRAFNSLLSQKQVIDPDILFLMETKSNNVRMEFLRVKLGFVGKLVVNCSWRSGGLCMLWSAKVQVILLSYSVDHIDVRVDSFCNKWWRLTGFYGNPDSNYRFHSWNLLKRLTGMSSLPWVCLSNFNKVLDISEKMGGIPKN